jgi:hypothetical protein
MLTATASAARLARAALDSPPLTRSVYRNATGGIVRRLRSCTKKQCKGHLIVVHEPLPEPKAALDAFGRFVAPRSAPCTPRRSKSLHSLQRDGVQGCCSNGGMTRPWREGGSRSSVQCHSTLQNTDGASANTTAFSWGSAGTAAPSACSLACLSSS